MAQPSPKSALGIAPLLKWTGGKRRLLKHLVPLLPRTFGRYFEPFMGGGALFFALRPAQAVLADKNAELINCYQQVRDHPEAVIEILQEWPNSAEQYYQIRALAPVCDMQKAARVIYLTCLSFNGIYRLNGRGEFNVPYGRRTHLQPCDAPKIRAASLALRNTLLSSADFAATLLVAGRGDLAYFDPPYAGPEDRTRFVRYNDKNFTWDDQIRLANTCADLVGRGVTVIVSNADDPAIRRLYRGFRCKRIKRSSSMAADGSQRGPTTECVFYRRG